jgi:hypothetical protein
VAKTKKLCPFSGDLCKECPLYRARHHYLCFSGNYRGYQRKPGEVSEITKERKEELCLLKENSL